MTRIKEKYNIYINIFITVSLLFFFCMQGTPNSAFAMSIEQEEKLGKELLESVRQQVELVDDAFAEGYINALGNYLIKPLESKPFTFNFYIIKDNQMNAFAGPGGHIFIYTGLIEAMDEIDELAAVICHEIAHVSLRHISDRAEKNTLVGLATMAGVLAGAMLGGEASDAIITGSMAAGQQMMLSYSREDERQADQVGFKYTSKSGFAPSAILSALATLQKGQWGIENIPPYLLTHPVGPERISNIESLLASYPSISEKNETNKSFMEDYPLFRTILRARYLDSRDAEKSFKTDLEKDPDSPLAHLGLAIILKDRDEYPAAIDHFQKALDRIQKPLPALRYLSETYQLMGENREAIKILEGALKLSAGDNKSILFLMAKSYQNLEEYSMAAKIYERLTFMKPVKDQVFYDLGLTYAKGDRLGLAHYNFGIYFRRLNNMKEAQFHFQKAEKMAGDDTALQDKIKKAKEEIDMKPGNPSNGGRSERR
ncbi:M48 family metalloprotease [Deltaproteobacteria bacterium]|nr:M48 family metalloprotease [Deltaproteobacteria bacterium]